MIGVCKFCGCTENTPCLLVAAEPWRPARAVLEVTAFTPCAWLLEDVCTAPECVAKAYAEANVLMEELFFGEAA